MKELRKHLTEILLIMVGVLAAFWLSQLGENRKAEALKTKVLYSIENELDSNHYILQSFLLDQDSLLITLEEGIKRLAVGEDVELDFNVSKPLLSDTGYELARTTGVLNEVNFDLVFKITKYYKSQQAISMLEDKILESILMQGIDKEEALLRLLFQLKELNRNQHGLLEGMKELREEMKEK